MKLKVRSASENKVIDIEDDSDISKLKDLIGFKNIESIKFGYPIKTIKIDSDGQLLADLGIKSGETLIINGKSGVANSTESKPEPIMNSKPSESEPYVKYGDQYLTIRVMKDDNSCLFNSISYNILKTLQDPYELRDLIASYIKNNSLEYNEAILGRGIEEYCAWIKQENSWGGAIEISIFAKYFNITIHSIDVQTGRIDSFEPNSSESNPGKFCVIIYSGIHYDSIAATPYLNAPNDLDTTVFDASSETDILAESKKLVDKLRAQHYYTDTSEFKVKCGICGETFKGEKSAVNHANATGHYQFDEK
ncbi:hypothetical protein CANCADRAFT_30410 [Tortispora caseinolytica NRRL Y-17796]|uniref:Ubiquitin thioesterase OTU n=1 Tax=Tortispora caseinolytica NRRL Y-17796 TaxID=767744 RepID=A0A1E4TKI5_9ASCO|nr:hypothetical protein CANCADRAFT_30410 [Tortispora caseinolytica NRRL Y-17796]